MRNNFNLKVAGVPVALTVGDSGSTSDEILGDAVYTFGEEVSALLAEKRLATYNGLGQAFESTLAQAHEEHNGEPWEEGAELRLSVDAGIAAVALLLSRGEPFAFAVDLAEGSAYWAFHDLGHADDDVSADWGDGLADFPPVESWAEDRANLTGARRALAAGLPVDEVLGALATLRAPFAERFKGEESSALDDLLAGGFDFLPEEVRPNVAGVREHIETVARDLLESNPDADLDDLDELSREYADGDGLPQRTPGVVLAALPEFADRIDDWGEKGAGLDLRAFAAFEGALADKVRDLATCPECRRARIAAGLKSCTECAEEE